MANTIKLPILQKDLDFPLMKALDERQTKRKWRDEPLSEQELSNFMFLIFLK